MRIVDNTLLWRNLFQLALVALLPFSASLIGEFGNTREAHYVYNGNMILLSLTSIAQLVHVRRHPALLMQAGFPPGQYHSALLRTAGLAICGGVALLVASIAIIPVLANYAYIAMWPLGVVSRKLGERIDRKAGAVTTLSPTNPSRSS